MAYHTGVLGALSPFSLRTSQPPSYGAVDKGLNDVRSAQPGSGITLVVDLDHTLIHATKVIPTLHELEMCSVYRVEIPNSSGGSAQPRWVSIRPGAKEFLRRFHQQGYQLVMCTNGMRDYAVAVTRCCLDPSGIYFGCAAERVVARDSVGSSEIKSLSSAACEGLFIDPRACIVVDDRVDVWKYDQRGQIVRVRPFRMFHKGTMPAPQLYPGRGFNASALETAEAMQRFDDSDYYPLNEAALAIERATRTVQRQRLPSTLYTGKAISLESALRAEQQKVLQGCVVAFSGVFPRNVVPSEHPLWIECVKFGATCVDRVTEETSHLVMEGTMQTIKYRVACKRSGAESSGDESMLSDGSNFDTTPSTVKIVSLQWLTESLNSWRCLDESGFPAVLCSQLALSNLRSKRRLIKKLGAAESRENVEDRTPSLVPCFDLVKRRKVALNDENSTAVNHTSLGLLC